MKQQNQGIGVIVLGAVLLGLASAALAGSTETPNGNVEKQTLIFGFSTDGSPVSYKKRSLQGFCGHVYDYLDQPDSNYSLVDKPVTRADWRFDNFPRSLKNQPGILCGPSSSTIGRAQGLVPGDQAFKGEFTQIFFTTNAKVLIRKEKITDLSAGQPVRIGVLDTKIQDRETPPQINCNRPLQPEESMVTTTNISGAYPHALMFGVANRNEALACLKRGGSTGLDGYAGDAVVLEDMRREDLKEISGSFSIEPPLGSFLREDYVLVVYNAPPSLAASLNKWLNSDPGMQARKELEAVREGNILTQWMSDLLAWANRGDHLSQFFIGLLLTTLLLICLGALSAWLLLWRFGWLLGQRNNTPKPLGQDERSYFSRELHDNVSQMLAAARLRIELAEKQLARNDNAYGDNLNISKATLDETIQDVRRISHEIRNGMEDALDALLRDFEERNGINVQKTCSVTLRDLPDRTADMLHRVMQEAMMNIERHAQASKVEVSLSKNTRQVRMEIRDNGRGFNPNKLPPKTGIGLKNMAERIDMLGGKLRIDSTPGIGTLVRATVPLP